MYKSTMRVKNISAFLVGLLLTSSVHSAFASKQDSSTSPFSISVSYVKKAPYSWVTNSGGAFNKAAAKNIEEDQSTYYFNSKKDFDRANQRLHGQLNTIIETSVKARDKLLQQLVAKKWSVEHYTQQYKTTKDKASEELLAEAIFYASFGPIVSIDHPGRASLYFNNKKSDRDVTVKFTFPTTFKNAKPYTVQTYMALTSKPPYDYWVLKDVRLKIILMQGTAKELKK